MQAFKPRLNLSNNRKSLHCIVNEYSRSTECQYSVSMKKLKHDGIIKKLQKQSSKNIL